MENFVVLVQGTINAAAAGLKAAGFDVYKFSEKALICRAEGARITDVTEAAGITRKSGGRGIALKLEGKTAGYEEELLWEWIDLRGTPSAKRREGRIVEGNSTAPARPEPSADGKGATAAPRS